MTVLIISLITALAFGAIFGGVRYFKKYQRRQEVGRELSRLTDQLTGFACRLEEYRNHPDPVDGIVPFFALTSKWHDRVSEIKKVVATCNELGIHTEAARHLDELATAICKAGRTEHGINRTKSGERVTSENIYLGDAYGLWTLSVASLHEKKEQMNDVHDDASESNLKEVATWELYSKQARGFIESTVESIKEHSLNASLAVSKG